MTWSATATGGVAPYQFQWSVYHADQWTVGPWTSASTWAWTPTDSRQRLLRSSRRLEFGQHQHHGRHDSDRALHHYRASRASRAGFSLSHDPIDVTTANRHHHQVVRHGIRWRCAVSVQVVGVQREHLERSDRVDDELDVVLEAIERRYLHGASLGAKCWELRRCAGGVCVRFLHDHEEVPRAEGAARRSLTLRAAVNSFAPIGKIDTVLSSHTSADAIARAGDDCERTSVQFSGQRGHWRIGAVAELAPCAARSRPLAWVGWIAVASLAFIQPLTRLMQYALPEPVAFLHPAGAVRRRLPALHPATALVWPHIARSIGGTVILGGIGVAALAAAIAWRGEPERQRRSRPDGARLCELRRRRRVSVPWLEMDGRRGLSRRRS